VASRIVEFFGYKPLDPVGLSLASNTHCPFVDAKCIKPKHGACSLEQTAGDPIIICPNRLYANNHFVLLDVAVHAFGPGVHLINAQELKASLAAGMLTGKEVVVFGKYFGSELSIPQPKLATQLIGKGTFFIDYILAKVDQTGSIESFTAVEIQSIDTTDSYKSQSTAFFAAQPFIDSKGRNPGWSNAGLNWSNVTKRILPQLIYKGYVLRRERLCGKGLFFVCPTQVLEKIRLRLSTNMLDYPIAAGTITFQAYHLGNDLGLGQQRQLIKGETFTTTVEQVAYAFVSPVNLPDMGVYEKAILKALTK
jgi:hypothetical protein